MQPNHKLHIYQLQLVKKLTTTPEAKFNDLLIEGLESEHMNYHLKKLIELGLIEKAGPKYRLTNLGKDYSNLMDDNIEIVEKQPKTSVIVCAVRKNDETGQIEHLVNRRLRHPYYGKVGRITGKIQFGETFREAGARELYEETGLKAENLNLEKIYHKIRKNEEGVVVQDVIFYILLATEISGNFIEKTTFQENFWMINKDLETRTDLDVYDDFELEDRLKPEPLSLEENVAQAEGY